MSSNLCLALYGVAEKYVRVVQYSKKNRWGVHSELWMGSLESWCDLREYI